MRFKLENIWIALGLMTLVFFVGNDLLGKSLTTYGITGDSSAFGELSNSLVSSYSSDEKSMKDTVGTGAVDATNGFNEITANGYTVIRNNPYSTFSRGMNVTNTIITKSGIISPIFVQVFGTIVGILVTFAVIYLIFRVYIM